MPYDAAVIGIGPGREIDISGRTHSFGYRHADAYRENEDCRLVAGVDLVEDYAKTFAEEYDLGDEGVYEDHKTMLSNLEPDIVSVCTPIPAHEPVVVDCAKAEVEAIHCEKPMAATWAEARGMAQVCGSTGTQLTFGHQRRFSPVFREAKRRLDQGTIGDLDRIEISWGNFFDNGSHVVDLAGMFVDEARAEWVMGQIDYRQEHERYGVPTADHAFMTWRYENGVQGILATGDGIKLTGGPYDFYDCWHRLVGEDGVIEIGQHDGPPLQIQTESDGWETIEVEPDFEGSVATGIEDVISSLKTGKPSELRALNALKTTEILFAGHESSRKRGRVEIPVSGVYDHPLVTMIETGQISATEKDSRPLHPDERDNGA